MYKRQVLLFVLLIYGIGGNIALVPLTAIPLIIIFSFFVQRSLEEVITATFAESAKKHAMLIESLTGLDAIKGARAEGVMQRKWEGFNARLARLSIKSRLLALVTVNFTQVVQQLANVGIVAAGVYAIIDGNLPLVASLLAQFLPEDASLLWPKLPGSSTVTTNLLPHTRQ